MKISCEVILDLIPLVKDGVASRDSEILVKEHLKSCESCKAEFQAMEGVQLKNPSINDEKIVFAIKHSIFITQSIMLVAGGFLGVALTNSSNIFYNLIIMPILGAFSYAIYKKKCYFTAIAIFLFTYIWQSSEGIISQGFSWEQLQYGLFFSSIYVFLIGIGVIIAMLLKFAFKKEG